MVALCDMPIGQRRPSVEGVPTLDQAEAVLSAAEAVDERSSYIIVPLLTGARTEEARALTGDHVRRVMQPDESPPVCPISTYGGRYGRGRHEDPKVPPYDRPGPARRKALQVRRPDGGTA